MAPINEQDVEYISRSSTCSKAKSAVAGGHIAQKRMNWRIVTKLIIMKDLLCVNSLKSKVGRVWSCSREYVRSLYTSQTSLPAYVLAVWHWTYIVRRLQSLFQGSMGPRWHISHTDSFCVSSAPYVLFCCLYALKQLGKICWISSSASGWLSHWHTQGSSVLTLECYWQSVPYTEKLGSMSEAYNPTNPWNSIGILLAVLR